MPCYQIRYTSVEFKARNLDLLKSMLDSEGIYYSEISKGVLIVDRMTLDTNTGMARVRTEHQQKLNELKQKYSRACVKEACRRKRWHVKQTDKNKGKIIRY